jgi:hypothetical protein
VEVDGGWARVAGARGFVGLLDAVVVVPGAFDGPWAGAFPPFGVEELGDLREMAGQGVSPVLRGECPPSRSRFGG